MIKNKIATTIIFMMFFPVFVRAAQDSSAVFKNLCNFEDGITQSWVNDTSDCFGDNLGIPSISSLYANDGNNSLSFPLDLDSKDSQYNYIHDAAYVTPENRNFSSYSDLRLYVYLPLDAGITSSKPLYSTLYIKTGSSWAWFESETFNKLALGEWIEVSLDLSGAKDSGGTIGEVRDLDDVKELGIHIFGASDSSGTTFLYIDSVQAGTLEHVDVPHQVRGLKVTSPGVGSRLNITWDKNNDPDLAGYYVYRNISYGDIGILVGDRSTNNYIDKNVTDEVTYYYQVSAYDIYGNEGDLSLQVSNTSTTDENNIFVMEGMSYAAWWNNSYESSNSDNSISELSNTGANFVALIVTQYIDSGSSNIIYADSNKTPTDDSVIRAINAIHSSGMNVMLKPHVDCKDGTFRGEIAPGNKTEWFSGYNDFIGHYAQLAEDNGVELLSLGCELKSLSGEYYLDDWTHVISNVENIYSGSLTYAANWNEYKSVSFWSYLDYAGIDAYFPLSDKQNPSVEELINGWSGYEGIYGIHNWVAEIENWQAQIEKPLIFTEIGYRSMDYTARAPWSWQDTAGSYNETLQASCYEAAMSTFKDKDWFIGMFWWCWLTDPYSGGTGDTDYTPQNKTAQEVLTDWYTRQKSPNSAPQQPDELSGPYCGITGTYYRYSAKAVDPDGDRIKYVFDWGDGMSEDTDYVDSGTEIGLVHRWDEEGKFNVRVKVIDDGETSSGWSEVLEVKITEFSPTNPEEQIPVDFSNANIYPNPWKINNASGASGIKFDNLTKNADLAIYNIVGELIYKKENIEEDSTTWELRNSNGESVVSGVYVYLLLDDKGNKKIGKVAVIK